MAQNDGRRYTLVHDENGDWAGLYDPTGKLLDEGHSLPDFRMLDALGIEYDSRTIDFEAADITQCEPNLADMPGGD